MSYRMRKICALFGCTVLVLSATACSKGSDNKNNQSENSTESAITATRLSTADLFTDRDKEVGYQEESCITISLSDSGSQSSSDSVKIDGSIITISQEGVYLVSGTLSNGQIIVNSDSTAKIQLVLNNADISSASSAPLYVKQADKVFITTAQDSVNHLKTSSAFTADGDTNVDGVIFSKDDLTLNGTGTLSIETEYGHGIVSKDDLVITSGSYEINASSHAISGKDSVCIADGSFNLTSGKDAIHSENTEETDKGFIYVANGLFTMNCNGDGLDASQVIQIEGGEFSITTDGDADSTKGLKSDTAIFLDAGTFTMVCADDSIHSNGDVEITAGTYSICTEDDGVHADRNLVVSSGNVNITKSYEGLEAMNITISGGEVRLTSSDDGFNAAGGNDSSGFSGPRGGRDQFASDSDCVITISGGVIHINAEGDGIDSNGNLTFTGGETYVCGPSNSGNGALDYAGTATISGGTCVAVGVSGMALGLSDTSTQGSMLVNLPSKQSAGIITLSDSSGKELLSYENVKDYNSVLISCPEITEGETYTLTTSGTSTEIKMTSLTYGNSGNGMDGGGKGGMGGNRGNGGMGGNRGPMEQPDTTQFPNNMELPENREIPEGMEQPSGNMQPPGSMSLPNGEQAPNDSPAPDESQTSNNSV